MLLATFLLLHIYSLIQDVSLHFLGTQSIFTEYLPCPGRGEKTNKICGPLPSSCLEHISSSKCIVLRITIEVHEGAVQKGHEIRLESNLASQNK